MTQSETTDTPNPSEQPEAGPTPGAAELAAAKKEAADNYDRYLRAGADLENFRRRAIREKEEVRVSAAARAVEEFLPVFDNLVLGVTAAGQPKADLKKLIGGVEMVLQQFRAALSNQGVKEINPKGEKFDPHQHEAISHEPSSEVPAEHILSVVRSGFLHNGRLLRPASVVVSSGEAKSKAS